MSDKTIKLRKDVKTTEDLDSKKFWFFEKTTVSSRWKTFIRQPDGRVAQEHLSYCPDCNAIHPKNHPVLFVHAP